jgi:spermidine synthase
LTTVAVLSVLFFPKELTLTKWYDRFENVLGELLFYREGAFGTVAVFQVGEAKELTINCIEEVPTHRDAIATFKLLGHLPLLLHENPKTVLVNAVGGGITLGAVTKHDVIVDAVDIVPDVRDAMALFAKENDNVLRRTNWRLIADDGRHFLKISSQRYDVITADATHPAAAESWVLYTREYYQLVKSKLTDNGVFAQWLPLHNMAPVDYLSALRTFRNVFPETLLLFTNRYTLMVGAKGPLPLKSTALDQRLTRVNSAVHTDLQELGISSSQGILKYIIFDSPGIDKLVGEDYPILTDDHTSVEFAELNRLGLPGTMPFILARLLPEIKPDALAQQYGVEPKLVLARALLMRSKAVGTDDPLERSFQALREVDQASRLAPEDKDIDYYKQITTLEFLDLLNARYLELLNSSTPQTLLPKASFAVQLKPQNPFLQELLGVTLLKLKRYEEAIGPLETAVSLKSDDVNYLSNLAFAYDQVGRSTDALRVLRQAKSVKPEAAKFLDEAIRRIEQKVEGGASSAAR